MNHLNRRQFLGSTVLGGAMLGSVAMAGGLSGLAKAASPNERVIIGMVGMSRGRELASNYARNEHCTIKYVCDTDVQRAEAAAGALNDEFSIEPEFLTDFRRILDDQEVDAVVLALPVHWHGPATILACQAGKHVYVEKPCCHNPNEGELMIAAARKHNRLVQMGNQRRSSEIINEAIDKLHNGIIGRTYYARCSFARFRGSIGIGEEVPVPENLDYDMWQGPAPRRAYKSNVIHYNWHWLWHWGTGEIGNNGTHVLDIARWGLDVDYPTKVTASGGRFRFQDDQETPDNHMATYMFPDDKMITWGGTSSNHPGPYSGFGITFYGEEGNMTIGGANYRALNNSNETIAEGSGNRGDAEHINKFIDAVRNEDRTILTSEIEEGHKSTLLPHLGNIAYRVGHSLECGEKGHILNDREAAALWQREYEPGWEPSV